VPSRGAVRRVHYSASKGGVVAMTRAMALELAPKGIRVNAGTGGPLGRMAQPDDIASVVVFVASDDARFITGQTVHMLVHAVIRRG
jgi:NAD(P)-dependent dehydrogenase (short-subunit alcohol dehydrogenase family)